MKDWNKLNPILADGEVGEIIGMMDTKTGDGKTPWKDLPFTGAVPNYSHLFVTPTDLATKQDVVTAATDVELADALALKADLASPDFTGTPTVNGQVVEDRTHAAGAYRLDGVVELGNQTGVINLDASLASTWTVTATGNLTLNFINVPATKAFEPMIVVKQGGAGGYTVSFSQNSMLVSPQWDTALAPTAASAVGAETSFSLSTPNGGVTWYGAGATPIPFGGFLLPTDFPPLQAWTAPPNLVASSKQPVAGVIWCTKLKAPAGVSLSKLWYYLSIAAVSATNSFLAVYDTAGNRLSVSANLSSSDFLGSQTLFRGTSMPAFTVPADGVLIIAVLVGAATTVPTFSAVQNSSAAGNAIAQDGSKGYGVFSYGSALTAMPAILTLSAANCTMGAQAIMFGVS